MTLALGMTAFWLLVAATCLHPERRRAYREKAWRDWVQDVVGLLAQGVGLPLLHLGLAYVLVRTLAPGLAGSLALPPWLAFVVAFVLLDYVYYWNHRLLHTSTLWPLHLVHHTVTHLDVFGTARNTLWTHLLLVPFWVNGALLLALADPNGYLAGVTLTVLLDLWRHSELGPRRGGRVERILGSFLVLPRDHAWHHAAEAVAGNYGQNLRLWDRLHGTWIMAEGAPERLGVPSELGLARRLLWPSA